MAKRRKRGKDSKFALAVHKAVQNSTLKTIDVLKIFKLHKKQDKFALNYLKNYVPKRTHLRVSMKVKQGKASVKIERKGYSFLISGRDLLPEVCSEYISVEEINKNIIREFFREKYKDFSERVWDVFPEYIGPNIAVDKRIKSLLALSLFSPGTKINFIDNSNTSKRLVNHAKIISETNSVTSKKRMKSADLNVKVKSARLGKFKAVADFASKVVHLREGDIGFLEGYVKEAKYIEVSIPDKLSKKFRKKVFFELAKASARMELRNKILNEDIERVKQLSL